MTGTIITSKLQKNATVNISTGMEGECLQTALPNDQTCLQIQGDNYTLGDAVKNGDLEGVKRLIEKEARMPWNYGSFFILAAEEGHEEIVKYLFEFKNKSLAEEQYKDIPRGKVLHKRENVLWAKYGLRGAISNNQARIAVYLLKQGVGKFPDVLGYAAEKGNLEMVKCLVQQRGDITRIKKGSLDEAAYKAILNGHLDILKYLVEQGANINTLHVSTYDRWQDHALLAASRLGNLEIVRYLVEQGTDIHTKDGEALLKAIKNEHMDIIKFLVEKGANINPPLLYKYFYMVEYDYPLPLASRLGNLEIVKYLVEQGADIHAYNEAALHVAIQYENLNIIEYLADQGADMDALHGITDMEQVNPLSLASRLGNLEVVKCLVERGADIHAQNEAALQAAAVGRHLAIVKYLVEKGADIHICKGRTLIGGCCGGNLEVVEYLAGQGVDIYAQDRRNT